MPDAFFILLIQTKGKRGILFQAFALEKGFDLGFCPAEAQVQSPRVFRPTFFQDIFPERSSCFLVEQAGFFERLKGISIQNLGPKIAVIS
jgi:hypothetical protein